MAVVQVRTLILMRHATAVAESETGDEARVLAQGGRRDASAAGSALTALALKPALALVSTSSRTRQTAELALRGLAIEIETRFEAALYLAPPAGIWKAFAKCAAQNVVVIGHNPGMAELVSKLIAQAKDKSRLARDFSGHLPTAAFVAFELRGELMHAAEPKLIGAWRPEATR